MGDPAYKQELEKLAKFYLEMPRNIMLMRGQLRKLLDICIKYRIIDKPHYNKILQAFDKIIFDYLSFYHENYSNCRLSVNFIIAIENFVSRLKSFIESRHTKYDDVVWYLLESLDKYVSDMWYNASKVSGLSKDILRSKRIIRLC